MLDHLPLNSHIVKAVELTERVVALNLISGAVKFENFPLSVDIWKLTERKARILLFLSTVIFLV